MNNFPYHRYDLIFVGGGLANTLAAYRLAQFRPNFKILLIEQGPTLGGNHTWSFHQNDLTMKQRSWIAPFVSKTWPGHDVVFPKFKKQMPSPYFSIRSEDFQKEAALGLKGRVRLNASVEKIFPDRVVLEGGETLEALAVIDGTGWEEEKSVPLGYQKFLGMDLTLAEKHGLNEPILMDATVDQKDGFRFIYVLPWDESSLLIEDTRYSNGPSIDAPSFRKEIEHYAAQKGWSISQVHREEAAALPIPLRGDLPQWTPGVARLGTKAGFFHATTGYSLPYAVRLADEFAMLSRYDGPSVFKWARLQAETHWEKESFHRFLNRMLFKAAEPEKRHKIFEKFYTRSEDLISRFYAGDLKKWDRARMLTGRPPVPIGKALQCLF